MHYLDDWCEYLRAVEGRSPRTVETYRYLVASLGRDMGVVDPGELLFETIERWLRQLYAAGRSESRRAGAVAAVKSFCLYLGARGVWGLEGNPARELRRPQVYQREAPHLRREEIERLIWDDQDRALVPSNPCALRDRVLYYLAYLMALRSSEVRRLRVTDLDWVAERRCYSVRIWRGKGATGDIRRYANRQASRLLGVWLTVRGQLEPKGDDLFPSQGGGAISQTQLHRRFGDRLKAAKIRANGRRLSFHVLRHSIATHFIEDGWPLEDVQQWLRHADIRTTQIYVHAKAARLARLVANYDPLRPKKRRVDLPGALGDVLAAATELGSAGEPSGV